MNGCIQTIGFTFQYIISPLISFYEEASTRQAMFALKYALEMSWRSRLLLTPDVWAESELNRSSNRSLRKPSCCFVNLMQILSFDRNLLMLLLWYLLSYSVKDGYVVLLNAGVNNALMRRCDRRTNEHDVFVVVFVV